MRGGGAQARAICGYRQAAARLEKYI